MIARRVRESGVYGEIHPFAMAEATLTAFAPKSIILSGGPDSVIEDAFPRAPRPRFVTSRPTNAGRGLAAPPSVTWKAAPFALTICSDIRPSAALPPSSFKRARRGPETALRAAAW